MIAANNPTLKSWIEVPENSDFPIQNIPFGIIKPDGKEPRPATRIGDTVIDLSALTDFGYFDELEIDNYGIFLAPVLNDFMELGSPIWSAVRHKLSTLFQYDNKDLQGNEDAKNICLYNINDVEMMLPVEVGDYTDFYSSIEHATNVGRMCRDPENALLPNWKQLSLQAKVQNLENILLLMKQMIIFLEWYFLTIYQHAIFKNGNMCHLGLF